ncbi:MAG: OFA family MFS transporter [Firmicutes bacterium]|nr:OFA family MFS transporter [Bacillota bacterium]
MGPEASAGWEEARWRQVLLAMEAMLAVSLYEYTFTLFQLPLQKATGAPLAAVDLAYTLYVVVQALAQIPAGAVMDRFGPRPLMQAAALLAGAGWILAGLARSLVQLWLAYGLGSLGPAIVYASAVSVALKWFPEPRLRGLVVGLEAGAFGAGSALFVPPVAALVGAGPAGWRQAFLLFGAFQLVLLLLVARRLRYPPAGWRPETWGEEGEEERRSRRPREVLATRRFYFLWLSFALMAGAGLMVTGNLAAIGRSGAFREAGSLTLLAVTLSRVSNGLGRLVAGWLSDRLGRPGSMLLFYGLAGVTLFLLRLGGAEPLAYVLLGGLFTFLWGPVFVLNPAAVGDDFGAEHAGANYGLLYTAKAAGGLFAGVGAAALAARTGGWQLDLDLAAAMALLAALLAAAAAGPPRPRAALGPLRPAGTRPAAARSGGTRGG